MSPSDHGAEAELLQRRGDEHELAFLEQLKTRGRRVVEIPKDGISLEESVRLTHEARRDGPDVIFSARCLAARGAPTVTSSSGSSGRPS
jgi:hypothetical protein